MTSKLIPDYPVLGDRNTRRFQAKLFSSCPSSLLYQSNSVGNFILRVGNFILPVGNFILREQLTLIYCSPTPPSRTLLDSLADPRCSLLPRRCGRRIVAGGCWPAGD